MPDQHALLFANAAFYAAFTARDLQAMDAIWSARQPVTCIHPGWSLLVGRDAVMASWQSILSNPNAPRISAHNATAQAFTSIGYVICHEVLPEGFLIATNIFVRDGDEWALVHHQAGPCPVPAQLDAALHPLQ